MLTARGWWLLTFVLGTLFAGALLSFLPLALIGLTLLLWFAWEWLLFAVRLRAVPRHLRVEREVWDYRGPVGTLWAGHTFRVRARLELRRSHLPYLMAADLVPFGVEHLDGPVTAAGDVRPGRPLALDYSIRCTGAGL